MKFSAVVIFAGAAMAQGFSNVTWTTEIVKSIVTYCPEPTKITHGGKTYTITSATTLTITDCPCTVTKPVTYTPIVECKTCNATKPTAPGVPSPVPTGGMKPSPPPVVAGAAKLSGAGLAAVLGAAILL